MPDNEIYKYLRENNMTDLDEKSFLDKYSDEKNAAELYGYFKGEGMTDLDFNSFHSKYLKKKSVPEELGYGQKPFGSLPDVSKSLSTKNNPGDPLSFEGGVRPLSDREAHDLIKKRNELAKVKKSQSTAPGMVVSEDPAFTKAQEELQQINERLAKSQYSPEDLDLISGFDSPTNISTYLKVREENPGLAERIKGATNWQTAVYSGAKTRLGSEGGKQELNRLISSQVQNNFQGQRRSTQDAVSAVYKYVDNATDRERVLKNLIIDKSYGYGAGLDGTKEEVDALAEQYPHLNEYQRLGLLFTRDTRPNEAQSLERLLSFDPSKEWLGAKENSVMRGYDSKSFEIEQTGINLKLKALNEKIKTLEKKGIKSEEDTQQWNDLVLEYNRVQKDSKEIYDRHPYVKTMEADKRMQESYRQNKSWGSRLITGAGENFDDALNFISTGVQGILSGDSVIDDLELLGDKALTETNRYTTEENRLISSPFSLDIPKDIQDQINLIKNNEKLTDEEKESAIRDIHMNNMDKITYVRNDKGGKANITVGSFFNGFADLGSELLPQIALGVLTGGASSTSKVKELINLFGTTFATSYNDNYNAALRDNISNPSQYAFTNTLVDAASELISPDVTMAKKAFGGVLGKMFSKIDDEAWDAMSGLTRGRWKNLKEAVSSTGKTATKNALAETWEEVAGGVANDILNEELYGQESEILEGIKSNVINTFLPMIGFGALSLPFNYKNTNRVQKYALYEAAQNYDNYYQAIEKDLSDGVISQDVADSRRKILDASKRAFDLVPATNSSGQPLTDNQKADYLHYNFVQGEIKERQKEAASETNEKLKALYEELDKNKESIISVQMPSQNTRQVVTVGGKEVPSDPKSKISIQLPTQNTRQIVTVGDNKNQTTQTEVANNSTTESSDKTTPKTVEKVTNNNYLAEGDLFDINIDDKAQEDVKISVFNPKTNQTEEKSFKASVVKKMLQNRSERLKEVIECML